MRVGARWLAAGTDAELRPVATSRDARKAAVSPAPLAVINCHFDVADFLLAHGANVSTNWNSHEPASILHISSSCGTRMSGCNSCSIVGQPDGKRITARGARHPPTVQKTLPDSCPERDRLVTLGDNREKYAKRCLSITRRSQRRRVKMIMMA